MQVLLSCLKLQKLWSRVTKCLVKMEKALHLYNNIFWEREKEGGGPHSHNLFQYIVIIILFYY